PTDPFKGKYITLNYEISSMTTTDSLWITNEEIYVYLKKDSLGFAEIEKISKQQLENDRDYVIAEVGRYNTYTHQLNIDLPFDRFYMEESKAKPAEAAFTKAQRDSLPNNTYALVYVKDGEAVLDNVFINDVPIAKYVEE
ncbi:MAG: GDYXXLXY domain-containing protein, partial [Bacteroidetes bacterium]|nr:GDYXXLXY domain-containing protein [Bacteroidota bacterium]